MLKYTITCILLCCCIFASAQKRTAQKFYKLALENIHFHESEELYKKAIAKDQTYSDAYLKLSQLYQHNNYPNKQVETLKSASTHCSDKRNIILAQLSKAAYQNGQYQLASTTVEQLNTDGDITLSHLKDCIAFSLENTNNPQPFIPINLGPEVNTKHSDYWPSISIDEKTMTTTVLINENKNNFSLGQEDFYISYKQNNIWSKAQAMSQTINTPNNEGAQTLSADGNTMLFTSCDRRDGLGACDIYITRKRNGSWSPPTPLPAPINTIYWDGHPSLSADGQKLFFSSDRPKGKGGRDIYVANITIGSTISIGDIFRLDDNTNTVGDEISPFIHADNKTLYFSSNGLIGLGRQDVYKTEYDSLGITKTAQNMGYPINTHHEELGLIVNTKGNMAYFASERIGSLNKDIYSFEIADCNQPEQVTYFKTSIKDKATHEKIQANFQVRDITNGKIISSRQNCDKAVIPLIFGKEYALNASKEGYLFHSEHIDLKVEDDITFEKTIYLSKIEKGESLILRNILFKHNSVELQGAYRIELDKALGLIRNNPKLNFEISGHTDSSGDSFYNQKLSKERAKLVFDYFTNNGISPERLSYIGYGDTQPISTIADENRRTELLIK